MLKEDRERAGRSEGAGTSRVDWPLRLSPLRLLLLVAFLVFAAEAAIMLFISALAPLPPWKEALVDAGALILFLSPLYFIVYRPLRSQYFAHLHTDLEIRRHSREMILSVERERTRFGKDLHDNCGQLLAALQLGIDILRLSLPEGREDLTAQCRQLQDLVGEMSDHVRGLSGQLRPPLLETCGLKAALEWHLEQIQWQGTACRLHVSGLEERLPPEFELTLFRLCQEGLANVVRHARARRAEIRLSRGPDGFSLEIRDDGIGFELIGTSLSGLGLIDMRERVAAYGGDFRIKSVPGEGTSLNIFFPIAEGEPA